MKTKILVQFQICISVPLRRMMTNFDEMTRVYQKNLLKNEQSEIPLNVTAYNFSLDYSSDKKEEYLILNIHEYLMVKNNIK